MSVPNNRLPSTDACSELAPLIAAIPPARRPAVMQCVASYRSSDTIEQSFALGPVRAAFAQAWKSRYRRSIPIAQLRSALDPPLPIGSILCFSKLMLTVCQAGPPTFLNDQRQQRHQ